YSPGSRNVKSVIWVHAAPSQWAAKATCRMPPSKPASKTVAPTASKSPEDVPETLLKNDPQPPPPSPSVEMALRAAPSQWSATCASGCGALRETPTAALSSVEEGAMSASPLPPDS